MSFKALVRQHFEQCDATTNPILRKGITTVG